MLMGLSTRSSYFTRKYLADNHRELEHSAVVCIHFSPVRWQEAGNAEVLSEMSTGVANILQQCTVLYCTVLHGTVLYCTVLHGLTS